MAKDNFDQSVSFPMDKGYFEQSVEEIKQQQKERDAYCMQLIEQAATTGLLMLNDKVIDENSPEASRPDAHVFKIDEDARALLESYYHDGMEVYRQMYLVFDSIFCEEENIQVVDPKTNTVIKDHATLKDITPNSCVKVFYRDDNGNKLILTYPGLKNVTRAIQKLANDGKYHIEYKRKLIGLNKKYKDNPEQLAEEQNKLLKPTDMMGDILRVSLSMKRYSDLEKWTEYVQSVDKFKVNPKRIKDKFCNNDVRRHQEFSEKNFRNRVIYLELPNGTKIEVQCKLTSLELVDNLTHPFYETLRLEKERCQQLEDALSQEELKKSRQYSSSKKKVSLLEYTILALNRWAIEKHNQHDVLDKVMRIEERKRVKGISVDESTLSPEEKKWYKQGMDPECVHFLKNNFLVRPKQALVIENPLPDISPKIKDMYHQYHNDLFNGYTPDAADDFIYIFKMYDKSSELQSLFRDASPELKNVFNKYKKILVQMYRGAINDTSKRFGVPLYALPNAQKEK